MSNDLHGEIVIIKRNGTDGARYPLKASKCIFGRYDFVQSTIITFYLLHIHLRPSCKNFYYPFPIFSALKLPFTDCFMFGARLGLVLAPLPAAPRPGPTTTNTRKPSLSFLRPVDNSGQVSYEAISKEQKVIFPLTKV